MAPKETKEIRCNKHTVLGALECISECVIQNRSVNIINTKLCYSQGDIGRRGFRGRRGVQVSMLFFNFIQRLFHMGNENRGK